ncbi:flagellar biosynthesis protein FliQ [Deferribacter autotrophicus]|uniref:Flagellar biosynthetic protein FliQ n=1 Tax=Deferribacter autotrophicus TaxID=500465 RepID=A0A5A8F4W6_9BACT|nr:flagellar biosynthesis protein FliQ [Deferribacter autotrophicus]KAA0258414.1 flagellar biosynthesis protein FliQ [Deferribacter autotrophicus]
MTVDFVIEITTKTLELTLMIAAPMLIFGLVVGLIVSIFQAVTQIQEMTLTFIPKILAVVVALIIFFPWIIDKLISFTVNIIHNIPVYIGKF